MREWGEGTKRIENLWAEDQPNSPQQKPVCRLTSSLKEEGEGGDGWGNREERQGRRL